MLTLIIPTIPLLNYILLSFASGSYVNWRRMAILAVLNMAALIFLIVIFYPQIVGGDSYTATLGSWLLSGLFEVNWVFAVDALTYAMLIVVLSVSTLVHFYSTEYMSEDPHTTRFISYLSLFTFFMLILITANNFVGLFLGWEGVGLCSYLLISFWYTRVQANKAAIKAMVVNRVSDLFFTVGILAVFYTFQTVEFNTVFGATAFVATALVPFGVTESSLSAIAMIAFLLFLGAMGKSAQVGLHTWLPDAMEGPTPVSALIHAATMVTAGVFLVIRCSILFEGSTPVLLFVAIIGAGTAFVAATSGLLQNDLKKVIAYSTCSQLGYMIFVCGLSAYTMSLFHLSTHAFFKALLFLSAGAVIHAVAGEQDSRRFGALRNLLPYTYAAFFVGSIALMGVPFLSGYYSKDLILEIAAGGTSIIAVFAYTLGLCSAYFTSFYSFRLLHLAFYGKSRTNRLSLSSTHELTPRMATALFILAVGSVFLGVFAKDQFVGLGTDLWNSSIISGFDAAFGHIAGEFLPTSIKLIPMHGAVFATLGVFVMYDLIAPQIAIYSGTAKTISLYRFLSYKWVFDIVYNRLLNKPILVGAYNITFSLIDKGLLEVAGPTGLGKIVFSVGNRLNRFQTGRAYDYAAVMFISALALPILLQLQSHLIVSNTLLLEVTAGFPLESGDHAVIDVIGVENFDNNLARVDQFPQLVGFGYMLFLTGIAGMVFNYKNFLITMMCIEIMYLGVITSFVFYGIAFNDTTAIIYGLLVLVFAACESAVGLGLLVAVYRFGRTISFNALTTLGG